MILVQLRVRNFARVPTSELGGLCSDSGLAVYIDSLQLRLTLS